MEYRKIISFGKSSHVISIPKSWMQKNKLKKGDLLNMQEDFSNLILSAKKEESIESQLEIVIKVDGKSKKELVREIVGSYINDYHVLTFVGSELNKKSNEIKSILHNLIALEIMEQTGEKIVAKDFLNMKEISIIELFRKIDIITRSMLIDIKNNAINDIDMINQRDMEINRLTYLIYRKIKYALNNPHIQKIENLNTLYLFNYWLLTKYVENIADEVKGICQNLLDIKKMPKNFMQDFNVVFEEIDKKYVATMKAIYTNNKQLALESAVMKYAILDSIHKLFDKYGNDSRYIVTIVEKMRILNDLIHVSGRMVYQ